MAKIAELRWLPKYRKFKRVFFDINPLCDRVQRDINQIGNANLSAINFHDGETTLESLEEENLNELNAMFMYSYLLKDILIKMDFGSSSTTGTDSLIDSYRHRHFDCLSRSKVSNKEFAKIKSSSGGLISFNSFLSTTSDRLLAQGFAEGQLGNPETKAILFKMNICSEIQSSPFTSLNGLSYMEEENEILFSMHTVFRIQSIQQQINQSDIWEVQLKLTSTKVDQNLALLTEHMQEELEGGTSLHKLGQLTARMGEYERAQEIYELLILSSPL
ncbi:unnamed protein product [Rotaria sp. Silwood2]|nr:unnamed protein product [Rotaria sp. Silwood2]CAF4048603.1 unnamed protein product [Rotaria sp. Silwood2]